MPSKSHTVKLPPDLHEVLRLRAEILGYQTPSAYLHGLIRYDALVQGPHSVTLPMSHLRDVERDDIDAQLLAITKLGVGQRGQLLSRLLEKLKADGDVVVPESIPAAIVRKKQGDAKKE